MNVINVILPNQLNTNKVLPRMVVMEIVRDIEEEVIVTEDTQIGPSVEMITVEVL